jgi:hypothetical protein
MNENETTINKTKQNEPHESGTRPDTTPKQNRYKPNGLQRANPENLNKSLNQKTRTTEYAIKC